MNHDIKHALNPPAADVSIVVSIDVGATLHQLRDGLKRLQRPDDLQTRIDDAQLVLEELSTNIIRHVLLAGTGHAARLEMVREAGGLRLRLWDDGPAYDPLTTTEEPGYGLRIIRHWVKEPLASPCSGNNRLDFALPLT